MAMTSEADLIVKSAEIDIELRALPSLQEAELVVEEKKKDLERVKAAGASYTELQTTDLHLLGAEDILGFVRYLDRGGVIEAITEDLPAEIQLIGINDTRLIGLPGEIFVEFGLEIQEKSPYPRTFVVELANGRMPGYVCTEKTYTEGGYEAGASLVASNTGRRLVDAALELLRSS